MLFSAGHLPYLCMIKISQKIKKTDLEKLIHSGIKEELSLQDLGFGIKNKLSDSEIEELDMIEKSIRSLDKIPSDLSSRRRELYEKIYQGMNFCRPGDIKNTMTAALKKNKKLDFLLPKGTKMYFDYPLSCVVVGEIQEDIQETKDLVRAFCEGYQEIYKIEEKSKTGLVPGMRNATGGCFGIWELIDDLTLEEINIFRINKEYHITFFVDQITFFVGS